MSFQVKGKVLELLPVQTGTSQRGEWKKQEFVIETIDEQFPKKICFTLFNDKIGILNGINVNADVEVSFNVESREYNGRWFHNVNAWKIELADQVPPGFDGPPPFSPDDIPADNSGSDDGNDLPF